MVHQLSGGCIKALKARVIHDSHKRTTEKSKNTDRTRQSSGVSFSHEKLPPSISSNLVHRDQLLSTFLSLHLPTPCHGVPRSHVAYLAFLPQLDLSLPPLRFAVDTLCLAEIGLRYEDPRCQREAQASYTRALPMLACTLSTIDRKKHIQGDLVLGIIMILALCELYASIVDIEPSEPGWIQHIVGAEHFVLNHQQAIASDFGELLFHNLRHTALFGGLIRRRASVFAQPQWLRASRRLGQIDAFVGLYDIGINVPGLLEKADTMLNNDEPPKALRKLHRDIAAVRLELDSWFRKHYHGLGERAFEVESVDNFPEFASSCGDRTFRTAFSFDRPQVCSQHQVYWILCLILDFTLTDTYRKYFGGEVKPTMEAMCGRSSQAVQREAFVAATNYCRTIPYSCEPETGSVGRIGTFLIRTLQSYFEYAGHYRELQWCLSARSALEPTTMADHLTKETGDDCFHSGTAYHDVGSTPSDIDVDQELVSESSNSDRKQSRTETLPVAASQIEPRKPSSSLSFGELSEPNMEHSPAVAKSRPSRPRLCWKGGNRPKGALVLVNPNARVATNDRFVLPRLSPDIDQVMPLTKQ
ncbi:hypothetical protein D0864_13088 [Hortaea werneckii]|uniref:Transcription factor domain-containing protein n=1 Tax=Hortaea werneckii TaxID=91943 RepID=A0A3M7D849_HORWE|nr:hypothetical protein D0864_13088 [Hortaea werneckii]